MDNRRRRITEREADAWDPKDQWAIIDGLDSIRWCWILLYISTEDKVNEYIDHHVRLVRAEPYKLNNIKELWSTAGWQIALDMRRAETFATSADTILANNAMMQKHMSANMVRPPKRKLETRRSQEYSRARNWVTQKQLQDSDTEKGKGKGKNNRGKDGGKKNEALCNNFNKGTCTFGDQCRFAH